MNEKKSSNFNINEQPISSKIPKGKNDSNSNANAADQVIKVAKKATGEAVLSGADAAVRSIKTNKAKNKATKEILKGKETVVVKNGKKITIISQQPKGKTKSAGEMADNIRQRKIQQNIKKGKAQDNLIGKHAVSNYGNKATRKEWKQANSYKENKKEKNIQTKTIKETNLAKHTPKIPQKVPKISTEREGRETEESQVSSKVIGKATETVNGTIKKASTAADKAINNARIKSQKKKIAKSNDNISSKKSSKTPQQPIGGKKTSGKGNISGNGKNGSKKTIPTSSGKKGQNPTSRFRRNRIARNIVSQRAGRETGGFGMQLVQALGHAVAIGGKKMIMFMLSAGGGFLVFFLIIIVVVILCGSFMGIFFSKDSNNSEYEPGEVYIDEYGTTHTYYTLEYAMSQIDAEYVQKINGITNRHPNAEVSMIGTRANWKDVLTIYAVTVSNGQYVDIEEEIEEEIEGIETLSAKTDEDIGFEYLAEENEMDEKESANETTTEESDEEKAEDQNESEEENTDTETEETEDIMEEEEEDSWGETESEDDYQYTISESLAMDVVEMDEQRYNILRNTYWDMTSISSKRSTYTTEDPVYDEDGNPVMKDSDTPVMDEDGYELKDEWGNVVYEKSDEQETETVKHIQLTITITSKTALEMAEEMGLDEELIDEIKIMMSEDFDELWEELLGYSGSYNLGSLGEMESNVAGYLFELGFSNAAVAGIMGNISAESGFNPSAGNSSSGAYGLFQFYSMKDDYFSWCSKNGRETSDWEAQMDYTFKPNGEWLEKIDSWTTSPASYSGASGYNAVYYNECYKTIPTYINATDPATAAYSWMVCYERPGVSEANLTKRISAAQSYYDALSTTSSVYLIWPSPSTTISSYFGPRESQETTNGSQSSSNHKGIDISCADGTDVFASASGTVTTAAYSSTRGNYIIIDHGNNVETLYQHLSSMNVNVGDTVTQGQTIALSGSTGNVTGPHLHFEVHINGEEIDPITVVTPGTS